MQEFNQMEMGGWLNGTILDFLPNAIQLGHVNCPVFEVKII